MSPVRPLCPQQETFGTNNLTRDKMDTLMDEMKQELEERLARIKTVH